MYQQVPDPFGGSLGLSALFAVLPLVTLFVLLAGLRLRAYLATLIALAVAVTVAIAVYGMPARQAFEQRRRRRGVRDLSGPCGPW